MQGRKVVIQNPGNYDKLKLETFEVSKPKPGELLIECKACGINFADCCVRMGVYRPAEKYVGWPITPGFEAAGIVADIGEGVTDYSVGQKVIVMTRFGGYSSHLTVRPNQLIPMPEGWSFEEAAGFPTVFLTAYYGLCELAHPREGNVILVHSAAGGVGSSLVQIGKILGCAVVGVVGASHKIEAVQKLGADRVIDKSSENLWASAERFAPQGYNIILDANGVETLKQSYQHLAPGGKLVVYGFHTMLTKGRGTVNWFKAIWDYLRTPSFNPLTMTTENRSVMAFNLAYLFDQRELFESAIRNLTQWIEEGKIHVPTVTTYPLEDVARAHKDLETGQTIGKLVLLP